MPGLLSGSVSRSGGSGSFISLPNAQPQLPATETTETGFTLVTDGKLVTSYRSSLGYLQFTTGTISNQIPGQHIVLNSTGTATVIISSIIDSVNSSTGALTVRGGLGVKKHANFGEDITANQLTIGRGYSSAVGTPFVNNIVFRGTADSWDTNYADGESNIAIGYDVLRGIDTANKSIAIGRFALSSGTNILRSIAIGDSALKYSLGSGYEFVGTATNAQANGYTWVPDSRGFPLFTPKSSLDIPSEPDGITIITVPDHHLASGNYIRIDYKGEPGGDDLDQNYYVKVISSSTFTIYQEQTLLTGYNLSDDLLWFSTSSVYTYDSPAVGNIGIGTNAGKNARNGIQNFFIGDNAAQNFTTGSYNYFLGPDVAQNMTRGNGIIAIGSDNLVDGVDDQINIGSVFYYNGDGYLQLNGDVGLGLGFIATSTQDAALAVLGGVGISENIIVGSLTDSTATTNGAAVIRGGAGIGGSVFIGGGLDVSKGNKDVNLSPIGGNVVITPTIGGGLTIYPNATGNIDNTNIGVNKPATGNFTGVRVTATATSTSTNTGALTVVGGVGINGNMFIKGLITGIITTATNIAGGARGSLPYQTAVGSTTLLPIGNTTTILVSDGAVPYWADVNSLLSNTATVASKVLVSNAAASTYYVTLNDSVNTFSNFDATIELTYNNVTHQLSVGSRTSATSTTTGALHVAGGVGIEGSAYSAEGGEFENNLLYVPRVIVSTSTPVTARIGDFWVEPNSGIELQYIVDGGNRVWIQFAGL